MLTDASIRTAKGRERPYKLTDGGGLYVQVTPSGSRLWRRRYEFGGKEKLLFFGHYSELGLAEARDRRHEAKQTLRKGQDSALARIKRGANGGSPLSNMFETIACDWHTRNKPTWTERHAADVLASLERDVFPSAGKLPITEFTPPIVLNLLRTIGGRPAIETAR